jgi:hypothetical protein
MVETGFGPIAILSEPVVAPAGGHPRPQTWSEGGKDNRISEITSQPDMRQKCQNRRE